MSSTSIGISTTSRSASGSCSGCATNGRSSRSTSCAPRSTPTASARACCSIGFHCRIPPVPDQEFFFALDVADEPEFGHMIGELVAVVLNHAGYTAPMIDQLTDVLRGVLADGAAGGQRRCDVRFQAKAGELQIVVARAGAAE